MGKKFSNSFSEFLVLLKSFFFTGLIIIIKIFIINPVKILSCKKINNNNNKDFGN